MNKKIVIIIISAVLVIALAVGVALSLTGKLNLDFSSKDKKSETTSSTQSNTENKDNSSNTQSTSNGSQTGSKIKIKKSEDVVTTSTDELVIVPVYITENPGIVASQVYVEYDSENLDFADCTAGDIFADCQCNAKDGVINCIVIDDIAVDTVDSTKTGVLFNIVLKPKSTAKKGTYKFTIQEKSNFVTIDEKYAFPTVSVGDLVLK